VITTAKGVLMNSREVAALLGVSLRTLWRLVKRGQLPPGIHFNVKLVRWYKADIEAAVERVRTAPLARAG
jgi:excisionase family DNA binding protein